MQQDILPPADRPKIKIRLNKFDWIAEVTAVISLIILIVLPIVNYSTLPERIPDHYNSSGIPDSYGSKIILLILPATGVFIYLLMTVLVRFPHIFNYPVRITAENAEVQYRLATRLMRYLKTVIIIMFTFISSQTIRLTEGKTGGLGKLFLPLFLLATFGIVIIYFVQSLNNSRKI
jgi:uncharacterized membrane protein